ncbi:alpha/beta hydrolase family protein [Cellulomonas sp. NTE-D12]|uniref:alpha/beta hydrolase n=1 Tax=Cellulomonas sp. NTE-D12 TaxID=2962632 RepID=UPI0030819320|nr:esterase [Cellulomonas sp. NTE-D12]
MALLTMNAESRFLRTNQAFSMILPDMPRALEPAEFYRERQDLPVVWLLHGTYGDHTDWVRKTNVERYAARKGVAVVMPSGLNSNYSNWSRCMLGYDMYDYVLRELMPMVQEWFPVSARREDNFIAGLSMGGRGAIKLAVNAPERFGAAAILSASPRDFATLTPEYLAGDDPVSARFAGMVENAGGMSAFLASEENVWRIIDERAASGTLPRLLFASGADDDYVMNDLRPFREHAATLGLDATFFIGEGYTHEWDFWDLAVREAFEFFGLPDVEFDAV